MADRINVCRDGKAIYDIVLTQSFDGLKEAVSCLPVKEHKICIVTDSNVAPLYLEEVRAALSGLSAESTTDLQLFVNPF